MQVFVRFYFFFQLKTLLNSEPQAIEAGRELIEKKIWNVRLRVQRYYKNRIYANIFYKILVWHNFCMIIFRKIIITLYYAKSSGY